MYFIHCPVCRLHLAHYIARSVAFTLPIIFILPISEIRIEQNANPKGDKSGLPKVLLNYYSPLFLICLHFFLENILFIILKFSVCYTKNHFHSFVFF